MEKEQKRTGTGIHGEAIKDDLDMAEYGNDLCCLVSFLGHSARAITTVTEGVPLRTPPSDDESYGQFLAFSLAVRELRNFCALAGYPYDSPGQGEGEDHKKEPGRVR